MANATISGKCPHCKVDLSKPYQVLYGSGKTAALYNADSYEFKPRKLEEFTPCRHELHDFARKTVIKGLRGNTQKISLEQLTEFSRRTTSMSLRGGDLTNRKRPAVKKADALGGDFSPIVEAVVPSTPDSLSEDEYWRLDDQYASEGQTSASSVTTDASAPNEDAAAPSEDVDIASQLMELMSNPSKKSAALQHFMAALGKADTKAEKLEARVSVAEILSIQPAPQDQKKLDLKENLIPAPRDVVEISKEYVAAPVNNAITKAAVLAVEAAQTVYELRTTPLTPASIIVPPNSNKSPVGLNLPHDIKGPDGWKKLAIASKLVTRLNLHGTDAASDLINAVNVATPATLTLDGIHVFVDASNIEIGFINALKAASGIPKDKICHAKRALVFDSLALILERGRKVAKRELVGSCQDSYSGPAPFLNDASDYGYNVSTPQVVKKLKTIQTHGWNKEGDDDWTGKAEYKVRSTTKLKNTEQLVDELIHLKMADSIIDADEPGVMVLATGDANAAEYSAGFFAYVERALKKGWKVEVVAWKESMATAYTKLKKMNSWGDNFMILELDEFRAELTSASKQGDWWKSN